VTSAGPTSSAKPGPDVARSQPGPQVPLDAAELGRLERWQHRIRLGFVVATALLAVWAVILLVAPDVPWLPFLALPFAAPLVVLGAVVQRAERCPRCEARVALESRLRLPERCAACAVALRPIGG
jgi:hypothetical protein